MHCSAFRAHINSRVCVLCSLTQLPGRQQCPPQPPLSWWGCLQARLSCAGNAGRPSQAGQPAAAVTGAASASRALYMCSCHLCLYCLDWRGSLHSIIQTEYSNKLAAQQGCWLLMGLTRHPKLYMTWHCSSDFSTYGCTWGQRSVSRQEDRQRSHNGFNVMAPAALIRIRPHQQPLLAQLLRRGLCLSLLRLNGRLCSSLFKGRLCDFLLQPGCSLSLRLGLGMGLQRPLASPFCFLQSFTQQPLHLQKPVPPQQPCNLSTGCIALQPSSRCSDPSPYFRLLCGCCRPTTD